MNDPTVDDVLNFWFEECSPEQWFKKDDSFDELVRESFLGLYEKVAARCFSHWRDSARGCLAEIIVLDQFSRNMFRNDPQAFAADDIARECLYHALEKGWDADLPKLQRKFLYMPLMHSEDPADQRLSIEKFETLQEPESLKFAHLHKDIIDRFGRYPHRNDVLGRETTAEERAFLTQPNSSF
ncbi:DUF924 family protein [Aestuariispira insulae]|uniref:Uncharacterized protein (DUF924 family) n=1 Tax=Aestuariispira insulae TaxID=1461337 RepID=A0A3D9HWE3_9PROT|nr:DUF924 family protein [Aestuariispira insulae]RED53701.1 uncharacterized protein (DUF924 family) [Aestuariispira insulae]